MKIANEAEMIQLGQSFGVKLRGGEVIELVGDVGAGKTTFAKGLALGLMVKDAITSPSFTVQKLYQARDGLTLRHYDFYRLDDAGIMRDEVAESIADSRSVTVVEWAEAVAGVLPADRRVITIKYTPDGEEREVDGLGD
jgi:tRNA threonylcarbamoyladenosine biosynthesis protein TsaE